MTAKTSKSHLFGDDHLHQPLAPTGIDDSGLVPDSSGLERPGTTGVDSGGQGEAAVKRMECGAMAFSGPCGKASFETVSVLGRELPVCGDCVREFNRRNSPPRSSKSLLARLRVHPGFANVIACLQVDRDSWLANERAGEEDYPGEARERREAYELVLELLEVRPTTPEPPNEP